jgi:hypothetical protein
MGLTEVNPVSRRPSLGEEFATIRQMLATLDSLTIAGQRHLMAKVVSFVDGQMTRVLQHVGPGNRRTLLDQLALLKGESDRQLPSVPVFGQRAESLIALLATGA